MRSKHFTPHPPLCSSHRLLCSTTNTSENYERTQQGNLLLETFYISKLLVSILEVIPNYCQQSESNQSNPNKKVCTLSDRVQEKANQ